MKSRKIIALAGVCALVVVLAVPIFAFAAPQPGYSDKANTPYSQVVAESAADIQEQYCPYVDENNDGVCDYCFRDEQGVGYCYRDDDGLCGYHGARCQGVGFSDANNDGICDTTNSRQGSENSHGAGRGTGVGCGAGNGCCWR